jgi:hypothetical protein
VVGPDAVLDTEDVEQWQLVVGTATQGQSPERDPMSVAPPDPRFNSAFFSTLLGQKRYAEAEPFLLQGYEGLKQREAAITISFENWLTAALERVIHFYEVTGQPEKARNWREKLKLTAVPAKPTAD